jgi:hypothetical protein
MISRIISAISLSIILLAGCATTSGTVTDTSGNDAVVCTETANQSAVFASGLKAEMLSMGLEVDVVYQTTACHALVDPTLGVGISRFLVLAPDGSAAGEAEVIFYFTKEDGKWEWVNTAYLYVRQYQ